MMYDIYAPDIKSLTAVSLTGCNFCMERCTVNRASTMWLMRNDHGAVVEGELTYGLGKTFFWFQLSKPKHSNLY